MRLLFIIRHISGNLRKYLAPTEIEESAGPSSKKRRIEIDNDTKINSLLKNKLCLNVEQNSNFKDPYEFID